MSKSRIWKTCLLIYFLSQTFFLINIQFPRGQNFDEYHYVPSAKQYLEFKENRNYEHPPLGKELMAVGIGLWGDRPIGWRFMSTVFGALTLVGMYLWSLAVFRNEKWALWTVFLTLTNQLLYVQSRIGMLDTFMTAFIVFAMAAFAAAWNPQLPLIKVRRYFAISGVMLGLATASKWFGVIPWAFCLGMILLIRVLQNWKVCFADTLETNGKARGQKQTSEESDWYTPGLWRGVGLGEVFFYWIFLPLFSYYCTFIPALMQSDVPHSLWDVLVTMQARMWDGQSRVVNSHPYMSHWTGWAFMARPIWYAFDKEGAGGSLVRGVILLGNPLIMWGGLVALIFCAVGWFKERRRDAMLIFLTYCTLYLSWIAIPRKVAFYYYYYPAGLTLSLAIVYVFSRFDQTEYAQINRVLRICFLGAATALFIYFFPILAALKIASSSYGNYMWFRSWI